MFGTRVVTAAHRLMLTGRAGTLAEYVDTCVAELGSGYRRDLVAWPLARAAVLENAEEVKAASLGGRFRSTEGT